MSRKTEDLKGDFRGDPLRAGLTEPETRGLIPQGHRESSSASRGVSGPQGNVFVRNME